MNSSSDLGASSRWIDLRKADDSVVEAARITLRSHLNSVVRLLPLAANHADENPEYVHQLRIRTRCSLAALSVYADFLPREDCRWFRKQMKRIRKAAGDARDLDVLLAKYQQRGNRAEKQLRQHLRKQRRRAQQPISTLCRKLTTKSRLANRLSKMLERINGGRYIPLEPWAKAKVTMEVAATLQFSAADFSDVESLHKFRIQLKNLRYTIELFADLLAKELKTDLYPAICEAQRRLGDLNDHVNAGKRFSTMIRHAKGKRRAKAWKTLRSQERQFAERARRAFCKSGTSDLTDQLLLSVRSIATRPLERCGGDD